MNLPDIVPRDLWLAARKQPYSTYGRGTDILNGTFNYLDLTALGRQEDWEEPPGRANASASGWWRLHDEY